MLMTARHVSARFGIALWLAMPGLSHAQAPAAPAAVSVTTDLN